MNLPTLEECHQMFDECHTPQHIRKHSELVMKVAVFMADRFNEKGINVNRDLVERGGLLHDIYKHVNFKSFDPGDFEQEITQEDINVWKMDVSKFNGKHHAQAAYDLLLTKGHPELAEVVGKHRIDGIIGGRWKAETLEEIIVYYADKRVSHRHVVSFDQRVKEAIERHDWSENEIKERSIAWDKVRELESEIFNQLGIDPGEINQLEDK